MFLTNLLLAKHPTALFFKTNEQKADSYKAAYRLTSVARPIRNNTGKLYLG